MRQHGLLIVSMFAVFGCQNSTSGDKEFVKTGPLLHDEYCQSFTAANAGTKDVKLGLDVEVPAGKPDSISLDYLEVGIYGYNPRVADAPACRYYSLKIEIDNNAIAKGAPYIVHVNILANLNANNAHYFWIEGCQRNADNATRRVLAHGSGSVDVSLKESDYLVDSLMWTNW